MSNRYAAKGTLFKYESSTGPSVFTTIPGVQDFSFPITGVRDEIDVTCHDSPGNFEETVLGVSRTQAFNVTIVWDGQDTHHAALQTKCLAGTLVSFQVVTKDTNTHAFSGYIKQITPAAPVNGAYAVSMEVKPTGSVTTT